MKQRYLFLMGLFVIGLALLACGESTAATPTTPIATPTIAYQLVSIDNPGVTPDAQMLAKYQTLLDELRTKTGDSEQKISDDTVSGQQILHGKGKDVTVLALLDAANTSIPTGTKLKYDEVMASLVTLMENS